MHPSLTACLSSNLAGYRYDAKTQNLVVAFLRKPGAAQADEEHYLYEKVPQTVFDGLVAASSKGTFFGIQIKNAGYKWRRLLDPNIDIPAIFGTSTSGASSRVIRNPGRLTALLAKYPWLNRVCF